MNKEDILDAIGHRELTAAEQQQVTEWCAGDKAFAESIEFQRQLSMVLHQQERTALKSFLQQLEEETVTPGKSIIRRFNWHWLAIAACLFVALGIWWMAGQKQDENLYVTYFRPYPNVIAPVTRNVATDADAQLQQAFIAYDNGQYEEAFRLFNILSGESGEYYARFYEALSLMGLKKTKEALTLWSETDWPLTPFDMKTPAAWYHALCLLEQHNSTEALPILQQIAVNSENPYAQQAEKIIRQLQ